MKLRLSILVIMMLSIMSCTTESDKNNGLFEGAVNCPGIDGIYYYALIPQGDCAFIGTTLNDEGFQVENHGVMPQIYSNCSESARYDGCTMEKSFDCNDGSYYYLSMTFEPGNPNLLTGTQEENHNIEGILDCVFEIYGSTDKKIVTDYIGLPEDTSVSDLTTPGIPNPKNITEVREECNTKVHALEAVCPSDDEIEWSTNICVSDWQQNDAQGCGDAARASTLCRTENAELMDCESGEITVCEVYLNAYRQCTSAFTASTNCATQGANETLCGDEGSYSYFCMIQNPPFSDCISMESESLVHTYCCISQ